MPKERRMKARCIASVAALAAALAACAKPAPPPPDENAIRTAIAAQLAKMPAIFTAKDTAALAGLFTPDATWILPDGSTFTGRANIVAGAKALFATYESGTMSPAVIDKLVVVSDSEAVAFTHGDYTMTMKGKKPQAFVNPYADLWKKGADGVWRVAYEVNAGGPAPAPAAPKH
jgi:uncharacterized protein (TIGR02246 family)